MYKLKNLFSWVFSGKLTNFSSMMVYFTNIFDLVFVYFKMAFSSTTVPNVLKELVLIRNSWQYNFLSIFISESITLSVFASDIMSQCDLIIELKSSTLWNLQNGQYFTQIYSYHRTALISKYHDKQHYYSANMLSTVLQDSNTKLIAWYFPYSVIPFCK